MKDYKNILVGHLCLLAVVVTSFGLQTVSSDHLQSNIFHVNFGEDSQSIFSEIMSSVDDNAIFYVSSPQFNTNIKNMEIDKITCSSNSYTKILKEIASLESLSSKDELRLTLLKRRQERIEKYCNM